MVAEAVVVNVIAARRPTRALLISIFFGLVATALLAIGQGALMRTDTGDRVRRATFSELIKLVPPRHAENVGVTVIDLSYIPGGRMRPDGSLQATDRKLLLDLVDRTAAQQPRAIGIDIDLSPSVDGWKADSDPEFLAHLLEISKTIPVFVGVYDGIFQQESTWLGVPQYAPLAASLWLPEDGLERTPVWLQVNNSKQRLHSLGAALAFAKAPPGAQQSDDDDHEGGWLERFVPKAILGRFPTNDSLTVGTVLTDSSVIEQMHSSALTIADASQVAVNHDRIANHIVLLGAVQDAMDKFKVPGVDQLTPGVFVHAATAYSLATPLWEPTEPVRIGADLLLAALLLVLTLQARRKVEARDRPALKQQLTYLLFVCVGIVFLVCTFAAAYFRVFWLDAFPVAVCLLLHEPLERRIHRWLAGRSKQVKLLPAPR